MKISLVGWLAGLRTLECAHGCFGGDTVDSGSQILFCPLGQPPQLFAMNEVGPNFIIVAILIVM